MEKETKQNRIQKKTQWNVKKKQSYLFEERNLQYS